MNSVHMVYFRVRRKELHAINLTLGKHQMRGNGCVNQQFGETLAFCLFFSKAQIDSKAKNSASIFFLWLLVHFLQRLNLLPKRFITNLNNYTLNWRVEPKLGLIERAGNKANSFLALGMTDSYIAKRGFTRQHFQLIGFFLNKKKKKNHKA